MPLKLLPCPFCGGNAIYGYDRIDGDYSVYCKKCGAIVFSEEQTLEASEKLWNTRTKNTQGSEQVESQSAHNNSNPE